MTDKAAFQAVYSGWRYNKTNNEVVVSFTVPAHTVDLAFQALNGMPDSATTKWCAIARLDVEAAQTEE